MGRVKCDHIKRLSLYYDVDGRVGEDVYDFDYVLIL
jgi:hypothetical protein